MALHQYVYDSVGLQPPKLFKLGAEDEANFIVVDVSHLPPRFGTVTTRITSFSGRHLFDVRDLASEEI